MKKSAIFFLIIILTACSTPTPQVTITSEVTVTLTPTPTQTPTPEPALPAEVVEKFDKSEIYSINKDGQIEMTVDGNTTVVEEIKFENGKMFFTYEGQVSQVDTKILKVVDNRIIFRDNSQEPKTWIFNPDGLRISEFVTPEAQGWVTYEETLSGVDFEINPKADEEAVFYNFISLLPNSLKKTEWNQAILDRVLEKTGLTIVANASDREKRIEFMKAFLEESGGIIDIYNPLNRETLEGVDLNLAVVHRSKEVAEVKNGYARVNGATTPTGDKAIYGNLLISSNGQMVIDLAHNPGVLPAIEYKGDNWSLATVESLHFHIFLENFGVGFRKLPFVGKLTSDPGVYLFGSNIFQTKNGEFVGLTWNKVTSGLLINK